MRKFLFVNGISNILRRRSISLEDNIERRTWNEDSLVPLLSLYWDAFAFAVFQSREVVAFYMCLPGTLRLPLSSTPSSTCPPSIPSILWVCFLYCVYLKKNCYEIMQLELLYKSSMQMKGIAVNLYFQLEFSSVFLCIPLGTPYFNGLKFSSFCNSKKNSVHL